MKRLSRWGIGPKTFTPTALYALAALTATSAWPDALLLPSSPAILSRLGAVLVVAGLLLWLLGVITVMRAYNRDRLATGGVFALVRHPVYAAWITLIFPGLALLTRSWPLFLAPLIAYTLFKLLIHREDEHLEQRFGPAYLDYRRRVNEIVPIPRLRQKRVPAQPAPH